MIENKLGPTLWWTDKDNKTHRIIKYGNEIFDVSREILKFVFQLENGNFIRVEIPQEVILGQPVITFGLPQTYNRMSVSIEFYLWKYYRISFGPPIVYEAVDKTKIVTYLTPKCIYCNTPVVVGQVNCSQCGGPYETFEEKIKVKEVVEVVEKPVLPDTIVERENTQPTNQPTATPNVRITDTYRVPYSWPERVRRCLYMLFRGKPFPEDL